MLLLLILINEIILLLIFTNICNKRIYLTTIPAITTITNINNFTFIPSNFIAITTILLIT